jgi:hypothetical protein
MLLRRGARVCLAPFVTKPTDNCCENDDDDDELPPSISGNQPAAHGTTTKNQRKLTQRSVEIQDATQMIRWILEAVG